MKNQSYKRHLSKTVTWRFVGTVDTMILSWIISGNPVSGLKISFKEVVTKMILYYFHERLWFKYKIPESRKRHMTKTVVWRFIVTDNAIIRLQIV